MDSCRFCQISDKLIRTAVFFIRIRILINCKYGAFKNLFRFFRIMLYNHNVTLYRFVFNCNFNYHTVYRNIYGINLIRKHETCRSFDFSNLVFTVNNIVKGKRTVFAGVYRFYCVFLGKFCFICCKKTYHRPA